MKFSRKTDYALVFLGLLKDTFYRDDGSVTAVIHKSNPHIYKGDTFVKNRNETFAVSVRKASEEYGIPYSFLEKVAMELKKEGIIKSARGRDGGYVLNRSPKNINMQEIINIFEKPKMMRCLETKNKCFMSEACPTKKRWRVLDKKIFKVFQETTLAEL